MFITVILFQLWFLLLIILHNCCELSKEANIDNRKEHSFLALSFLVGAHHAALPSFGLAKLFYNSDVIQYYRDA